jgi:nicotinamide-nucleotide amidase
MNATVTAELISVGTELLRGEIVDTNSSFIAAQLPHFGITLQRMSTAGDNLEELSNTLLQALKRSDLVIMSGGLGPTEDDLTREAVAAALNETLKIDPQLEKNLRLMFSRFGREMPPHNIKQAMIIPSAAALSNPRGTAPGWWVEKNGKVIILLPGPPREMTFMWQNEVVPRLKARFPTEPILSCTIKTFFIPEATVAELLEPFFAAENPTLGIYAKPDGIQVRLIACGHDASPLLEETEHKIKELLVPYVWGKDEDTLPGIVGSWLVERKLTLATMEDATGGLLADEIVSTAESQNFYHGGLIAPNDHAKISWGVAAELINKYGAICPQVAEAMATAVMDRLNTDIGIGVTGIGAPDSKQPGIVFIGISNKNGTKSWQQQYQVGRADTRERAAIAALFRLRERLLETQY